MATIKIKNPNYVEGESDKWIPVSTFVQSESDKIITTKGDGTKYLSDDGTYKEVVTDLSDYYTSGQVDQLIDAVPEPEVTEAPIDGNQYVRCNGEWSEINNKAQLILNVNTNQNDKITFPITIKNEETYDVVYNNTVTAGIPVTIKLYPGVYEISSDFIGSDYKTPDNESVELAVLDVKQINFTFLAENVRVKITSDTGKLPEGFTLYFNGSDCGNVSEYLTNVAYDGEYTVSVSDVRGWFTPEPQTFTASQTIRNIELKYIYVPYTLTTIRFDQSVTDPASMITRIVDEGGIEDIRANSHRYLGQVVDGVMLLRQLDDTDSTKYANGDVANLMHADFKVWMKLPQFYYRFERIKSNVWNISFACGGKPNNNWIEWDGKDLIGVYKAYITNLKVYSNSNVIPTVNTSQENFKTYARNNGTGYSIVKWKHHCIMAWLFYAWYSNTNCQAICGSGTSSYPKTTGATNSLGMTDTTIENGNSLSINFWGLENWWGDIFEIMDNVSVTGSEWVITEDDGSTRSVITPALNGYMSKLYLLGYLDMLPEESEGTSTTGLCDYYSNGMGANNIACRSNSSNVENGGVAYINAIIYKSSVYDQYGSRLAYRGDYIIIE